MPNQPFFAKYDVGYGIWKSVKDWFMSAVAAVGTIAWMNFTGLAQQCPDAVVSVAGVTITLKALLNFINNYRKHKD